MMCGVINSLFYKFDLANQFKVMFHSGALVYINVAVSVHHDIHSFFF